MEEEGEEAAAAEENKLKKTKANKIIKFGLWSFGVCAYCMCLRAALPTMPRTLPLQTDTRQQERQMKSANNKNFEVKKKPKKTIKIAGKSF